MTENPGVRLRKEITVSSAILPRKIANHGRVPVAFAADETMVGGVALVASA